MKSTILFALLLCSPFITLLHAQNTMDVVYEYDHAGNRVLRYVLELRSAQSDKQSNTDGYYASRIASVSINAYPNPTQDNVRLEFQDCKSDTPVRLKLYGIQGQLLREQEGDCNDIELQLEGHPAGVYLLDIQVGEDHTSWKIIKR